MEVDGREWRIRAKVTGREHEGKVKDQRVSLYNF